MQCPNCNAPIDEDTIFCGNCGNQVAPLHARGATVAEATELLPSSGGQSYNDQSLSPFGGNFETQRASYPQQTLASQPRPYTPANVRSDPGLGSTPPLVSPTPPPSRPTRKNNRFFVFLGIILVLLIIAVGLGGLALLRGNHNTGGNTANGGNTTNGGKTTTGNTTGNGAVGAGARALVSFGDSQNGGNTSALKIAAEGLAAPPSGSQYVAWLEDVPNERFIQLGPLTLQSTSQGQVYSLDFSSNNNTNLIGAGNMIEITQESGNVSGLTAPTGQPLLSGTFPPNAFIHIRHLLFSFPSTPNHIGLLVGLREQAERLNGQALVLKNASVNGNQAAVRCVAQTIIDIAEGQNGQHYQQLPANCAQLNINQVDDGFGLLGNGYIATAAAHANLAATQKDSTDNIKIHAHHVIIATTNIQGWVTTVDKDAVFVLNNPGATKHIQEIVSLSNRALNGIDLNNDESVDPVPGEAGAITAYLHGQLMAMLTLTPATNQSNQQG